MNKIVVYSIPTCSKCQILKKILDTKKIDYKVESNLEKIMDLAREIETSELPIMTIKWDEMGKYGKSDIFSGSEAVMKGKEMGIVA